MKIIQRLSIAVIALLTITSCSDNFFDVNDDVNNPTFSTPELSLPSAQKRTVDLLSGDYNSMNTLGNLWTYSWAAESGSAYFQDETAYRVNSAFRPTIFTTAFLGPLANYDYVEKNADPKYSNYKAIAMIMKAYHFQYLVDAYGDIPYTEAFQRANNPRPKYDDAQTIYNDLIVQLTAAQDLIANPSSTAVAVGSKDIMCGGDMAKWARFANTLKLRILLRQVPKLSPDFSSVNNGIGFLGAGETVYANPGYVALVAGKQNPFYNAFKTNDAGVSAANDVATKATPFALSRFDPTDARKAKYWNKVGTTANYGGIEQNDFSGPKANQLSSIGTGIFKSASMSGIIMQSAESFFLQAEAVERGLITSTGTAASLYAAGVQENFTQVDAGSAASYLAASPYGGANTNERVQLIFRQKFIALMSTNGFENWIEARRLDPTGFNAIPVARNITGDGAPYGPNIPVRLFYPTSEYSSNSANVPPLTTGDQFTKKVFWDN